MTNRFAQSRSIDWHVFRANLNKTCRLIHTKRVLALAQCKLNDEYSWKPESRTSEESKPTGGDLIVALQIRILQELKMSAAMEVDHKEIDESLYSRQLYGISISFRLLRSAARQSLNHAVIECSSCIACSLIIRQLRSWS